MGARLNRFFDQSELFLRRVKRLVGLLEQLVKTVAWLILAAIGAYALIHGHSLSP